MSAIMPNNIEELRTVATRAARRLMTYPWKVWFWGDSVGLEGLLDCSEFLNDSQFECFVYGLMKSWIARREPLRKLDYTAPGVSLLRLYEKLGDPVLLAIAQEHGAYLAKFRQAENGAYIRYTNADLDLPPELPPDHPYTGGATASPVNATKGGPCVFVDNMHFDGPFYAKLYRLTGEERWRLLALGNILPHVRLLIDEETNLFHHFWVEQRNLRNGVLWGRGQGWALLGLVHTLEELPQRDSAISEILEILKRLICALAHTQDASGHWHTVINDPESYLETSIAAFVVDGFSRAILHGWVDRSFQDVVDRAFQVLISCIGDDGTVKGVSYETYPSFSAGHYKTMPRGAMVPWGQGPFLAAIRSYCALSTTDPATSLSS